MERVTFHGQKIAVLGAGREGLAAVSYLLSLGIPPDGVTVLDEGGAGRPAALPSGVGFVGGAGAFDGLDAYDRIIRSPGISPYVHPRIAAVADRVTTLARLFFDLCPANVIAVSGTKGKSTVATLLCRVIEASGRSCRLLGNIGVPPLPAYDPADPPEWIVIELSSYMLDGLEKRNAIGILLNIYPDHLDWHGSFEAYRDAKLRILKGSEYCYIGSDLEDSAALAAYGERYGVLPEHEFYGKRGRYAYRDGSWYRGDERLFGSGNMRIIGTHVYENLACVIAIAERIGIGTDTIRETFEGFGGLPHRLEYVATKAGVDYYDDAISTTPESAMAAIRTVTDPETGLGKRLSTIFLGGQDRGYDYRLLGETLARVGVENVVLFRNAGENIRPHLPEGIRTLATDDMAEAVAFAARHSPIGTVCLLSTAAPSYTVWKNFEEKGDRFKTAVRDLPEER